MAHSTYKKFGCQRDYELFRKLRKECKQLCIKCYNDFVRDAEKKIYDNPTQFWNFMRIKKRSDQGIPSNMEWNDRKAEGEEKVGDLFADFFSSIYHGYSSLSQNERDRIMEGWVDGNANLGKIEISFDKLLKGLLSLDLLKGPGPDGIPNVFLRIFAFLSIISAGNWYLNMRYTLMTPRSIDISGAMMTRILCKRISINYQDGVSSIGLG